MRVPLTEGMPAKNFGTEIRITKLSLKRFIHRGNNSDIQITDIVFRGISYDGLIIKEGETETK